MGCCESPVRIAVLTVILGLTVERIVASGLNDVISGKGAPGDCVVLVMLGKIFSKEFDRVGTIFGPVVPTLKGFADGVSEEPVTAVLGIGLDG